MTPAFFRFPTSLFVVRRFPLVSRPVSGAHNLTVSRQSHFEAKKARFGPKSLDSLIAKNLGYDQGL
jgi:hypothetical protein